VFFFKPMKNTILELIVEILERDHDWGRAAHTQHAQESGHAVRVLSFAGSQPPADAWAENWVDLNAYAEKVRELIVETYPRFLHHFVQTTGLLEITTLRKKMSVYWLMPMSEMSLLRGPFIDKIYALFMLQEVLKDAPYQKIMLVSDDPLFERSVRQLAAQAGIRQVETRILNSRGVSWYRRSKLSLIINWWLDFLSAAVYWFVFHIFHIGRFSKNINRDPAVLGLTIFPTLWASNKSDTMDNLAFGDFPAKEKEHGNTVVYAAIPTLKIRKLLAGLNHWRRITRKNNILFVHSLISFKEMILAYARTGWGERVAHWHKSLNDLTIQINNVDITDLARRELLRQMWEPNIPQSILIAHAAGFLSEKMDNILCAVHAFEFQPIEKAFAAGVKIANPQIPVIGLQTSLIGKNHLGYHFLPEQMHPTNEILPPYAPLPDYVATYGDITHSILMKTFAAERMIQAGPVRYPYLKINSDESRQAAEAHWKERLGLHPGTVLALLALPSLKDEALTIMEWAVRAAREYPELYLLVRFHYWAVLTDHWDMLARATSFDHYHIASGELHDVLLASRFTITGTSSIGIEAMISGCVPISYKTAHRFDLGRVQDVAEGAFFYTSETELRNAVHECFIQGDLFEAKKAQRAAMVRRFCNPLDGKASTRLHDWLADRGVINSR
jgi:hypothetical protein